MKEYESKEAFAKLRKNPKLVFKSGGAKLFAEESMGKLFPHINFNYYSVNFDENIDFSDMKWTLVPQPVSFIDVINCKKLVRVEHCYVDSFGSCNEENNELIEKMIEGKFIEFDRLLYIISNSSNSEELRDILLNGKWYIEED